MKTYNLCHKTMAEVVLYIVTICFKENEKSVLRKMKICFTENEKFFHKNFVISEIIPNFVMNTNMD